MRGQADGFFSAIPPVRARVALAAVAVALGMGCGDTPGNWYPASGTDEEQVVAVAERYETAADNQDFLMLCADVLSPSLLGDQTPEECADGLSEGLDGAESAESDFLNGEDIEVKSVTVKDGFATARVIDGGERGSFEFLEQQGRWYLQVFN